MLTIVSHVDTTFKDMRSDYSITARCVAQRGGQMDNKTILLWTNLDDVPDTYKNEIGLKSINVRFIAFYPKSVYRNLLKVRILFGGELEAFTHPAGKVIIGYHS
jgi:hypothetical protein